MPISSGFGVEREVIYLAFRSIIGNPTQWFLPRCDERSTLKTLHSGPTSSWTSSKRIRDAGILGACTALMMIYGFEPSPLDPCLLQFIANGCDLNSLHPAFIREWHAELFVVIKSWIDMGHTGNVTDALFVRHFATFHDIQVSLSFLILSSLLLLTYTFQVSSLTNSEYRDEIGHQAMAAEMLYRATIGPESFRHPEFQAFIKGFRLPCPNGFNFSEVMGFYLYFEQSC